MEKLKPCPICGSTHLFEDYAKYGILYGYGIGCLNLDCDCEQRLFIKYGFSERAAKKNAIKAWNKRKGVRC